jgi:very-short-patch-repair endonuclease
VPPDDLCVRTATAQYGLFSLGQARAAGLTRASLQHRLSRRRFEVILPGVYAMAGAPASFRRDLMAACLWAGPGAAVSHRAAAHLWGWDGFGSPPVEVSTVTRKRPHSLAVTAHRVDDHLLPEIMSVAGIPVTSPRRTLLDIAGVKHPRLERALDQALRESVTSLGHLWLLYEQEWTRGRRGIALLRELLIQRTPGEAPSHSQLEIMLSGLVRREHLPSPARQYPVPLSSGIVHLDFAYPGELLDIETDGYAWHMDREAFERDRRRDNELAALGWLVLRFTYAMLKWEPEQVAQIIRTNLYNRRNLRRVVG